MSYDRQQMTMMQQQNSQEVNILEENRKHIYVISYCIRIGLILLMVSVS